MTTEPDQKQLKADPKPVTGFDYAGQPMGEGDSYNGRPEHIAPQVNSEGEVKEFGRSPQKMQMLRERMAHARLFRNKDQKKVQPEDNSG